MAFRETGVSSTATMMRNMKKKKGKSVGVDTGWLKCSIQDQVMWIQQDINVVLMSESFTCHIVCTFYSQSITSCKHPVILWGCICWVWVCDTFHHEFQVMWTARKLPRDVLCERNTQWPPCTRPVLLFLFSLFSQTKPFSSTMSIIDNLKEHINHSLVFRIINIIVACFMVIGGVCVILTGGMLLDDNNNHHVFSSQYCRYHVRISTVHSRHLLHCLWCHGVCIWIPVTIHHYPACIIHVFILGTRTM